jgi:intracellular sulfur oxidation DsrE/DsrF family protein
MKQLKNLFVLLSSVVMSLTMLNVYASQAYEKQQVVYHVNYDNAKRQAGALRNIQNHINAVGADNLEIKVVMHGKGLSLLLLPEEAQNTKFSAQVSKTLAHVCGSLLIS